MLRNNPGNARACPGLQAPMREPTGSRFHLNCTVAVQLLENVGEGTQVHASRY